MVLVLNLNFLQVFKHPHSTHLNVICEPPLRQLSCKSQKIHMNPFQMLHLPQNSMEDSSFFAFQFGCLLVETDPKKPGQYQKLTPNKKSIIFELSS